MRFLIVDDSSTMRRIIINTLNKLGHQDFVEASNGREGIERLTGGGVDMIITDWNMPEMNGIDFIKAVRGTATAKDVPVLDGDHQRGQRRHRRSAARGREQLRGETVHRGNDQGKD